MFTRRKLVASAALGLAMLMSACGVSSGDSEILRSSLQAADISTANASLLEQPADIQAPSPAKAVETGILNMWAEAMAYRSTPMIDTIIIEYGDTIVLPIGDPGLLYSFTDHDAPQTDSLSNERRIIAVYQNDQPNSTNDNRISVPGRYVVVQMEKIERVDQDKAWSPWSRAGFAVEMAAGSDYMRLRTNYTSLEITQNFDAHNGDGLLMQPAGILPALEFEQVLWPELSGFSIGNTLEGQNGTIYYSYFLPDGYDPDKRYPLVVTLPGYGALMHSTEAAAVGINVYDRSVIAWTQAGEDVIVLAPQLEGWGDRSAQDAIALTEYFIEHFAVDVDRIYGMGYSAGGETMSRVLNTRADLFAAYLHCSSRWNGGYTDVVAHRVPVYIFMGEQDEYYGPQPAIETNRMLRALYTDLGLTGQAIDQLVVLDMPNDDFFNRHGVTVHHAGSTAVMDIPETIGWVLAQRKYDGTD